MAILDNLTNFYRQRRLWQQAAAVCAEAVACAREAHGDTSQKVGPFLEKHAQLLILSGTSPQNASKKLHFRRCLTVLIAHAQGTQRARPKLRADPSNSSEENARLNAQGSS